MEKNAPRKRKLKWNLRIHNSKNHHFQHNDQHLKKAKKKKNRNLRKIQNVKKMPLEENEMNFRNSSVCMKVYSITNYSVLVGVYSAALQLVYTAWIFRFGIRILRCYVWI